MSELVNLLVDHATRDGQDPSLEDLVRSLDDPDVMRVFQAKQATGALSGMDKPATGVMKDALAGFVARGNKPAAGQSLLAVRAQKSPQRRKQ